MRWEDIRQDEALCRGQFEWHELGITYRGQIRRLIIGDDCLQIEYEWRARKTDTGADSLVGPWQAWPVLTQSVPIRGVIPTQVGVNVEFHVRSMGARCVLIPANGSALEYAYVQQPAPLRRKGGRDEPKRH